MNRRESIKMLAIASGGIVALPSWAREWSAGALGSFRTVFSTDEGKILAVVADTIIPAGNSVGALSVGVDKFLLKLISDCYDKETQDNVKRQLDSLERAAQSQHGKPFALCGQPEREALLLKLSNSEDKAEKDFFTLIKTETIRGFTTSREVMVNHHKYKPVPGHYYGCVDAKA